MLDAGADDDRLTVRQEMDSAALRQPASGTKSGLLGFDASEVWVLSSPGRIAAYLSDAGDGAAPLPDFSVWGAVERKPMGGVRRTTGRLPLQKSWL